MSVRGRLLWVGSLGTLDAWRLPASMVLGAVFDTGSVLRQQMSGTACDRLGIGVGVGKDCFDHGEYSPSDTSTQVGRCISLQDPVAEQDDLMIQSL